MEVINDKPLNQFTQSDNKLFGPSNGNDGMDDLLIICFFVLYF